MSSKNERQNEKDKQKKSKKGRIFSFKYFFYDFFKIIGSIPTLIILRLKKHYISKQAKKKIKGGAIVAVNHVDFIDPVKLLTAFWYRRIHIVALKEFFNTRAKNWFFRSCLCIPVDQSKMSFSIVSEVRECLEQGGLVGIFPEGHINTEHSGIKDFKAGTIVLAKAANVPIIPAYIKPNKHWYNRVHMAIGEPIYPKDFASGPIMSIDEIETAAEYLHTKVSELRGLVVKEDI